MKTGISVYPGLNTPLKDSASLIERAAANGITRLFTSLQIPETDTAVFRTELIELLSKAKDYKFDVIADISQASSLLGENDMRPEKLLSFGITTLRLDDGFSPHDAAVLLNEPNDIRIQLNASTITKDFLNALMAEGADMSRVDALHNYYPRENTGLDTEFFLEQNKLLHSFGIPVGAFAATIDPPGEPSPKERRRAPLFCGLPTLEDDRSLPTDIAIRHLAALGVDSIFIGDGAPNDSELSSLSAVMKDDTLTLHASILTTDETLKAFLQKPFTARRDKSKDVLRAIESRGRIKEAGISIRPSAPAPRPIGAVTLDNCNYPRYTGELEIVKRTLPADARVNVIAQVDPEELFLIDCIRPGQKFRLRLD